MSDRLKRCVLVDIEATLSDNRHRENLLPSKKLTGDTARIAWDKYYSGIINDPPYRQVVMFCNSLVAKNIAVILLTGVTQKFNKLVRQWLEDNSVAYSKILMRKNDDFRSNVEVKSDLLHVVKVSGYRPVLAIDDMSDILDMYKENDINCLLATYGKLTAY